MSCTFNCNQGRSCSCGFFHTNGGRTVDTQRDEAPQVRFPFAPGVIDGPQEPSGLFASRAFWIGGALSILFWTALVLVLHFR